MQTVPELIPYDKRAADEKYLLVNTTAIDVKKGDVKLSTYKTIDIYNKSGGFSADKNGKKIAKIGQTIFTYNLNKTLHKMGYVDTRTNIFNDANNSLYIAKKRNQR